jgi:hypothetical protein
MVYFDGLVTLACPLSWLRKAADQGHALAQCSLGQCYSQGVGLPKDIEWSGEVPAQKWMNFYTKVVSKFAAGKGVKLKVTFEAMPEGGVSQQKLEETRAAIRELGLDGDVSV